MQLDCIKEKREDLEWTGLNKSLHIQGRAN